MGTSELPTVTQARSHGPRSPSEYNELPRLHPTYSSYLGNGLVGILTIGQREYHWVPREPSMERERETSREQRSGAAVQFRADHTQSRASKGEPLPDFISI